MFKTIFLGSIVLLLSTFAFAQNKSVYTELAFDKCKNGIVDKVIPGNVNWNCAGVSGYILEVYLDDERNSIGVSAPSKKVFDLNFWGYFSNFSELGDKAEWRMKGNFPVALIVRLNVSDKGDGNKGTSYLVVSKITKTTACVTDIVKPGKSQNLLAQQLADSASNKPCKKVE